MPPDDVVSQLLDSPEWEAESRPIEEASAEAAEPEEVAAADEGEPGTEEEPQAPERGPAPEEGEEEDEDDEEEEGAESVEEDEEEEVAAEVGDLEVQAFLAKYGNDPDKALKGAAELARLMGRQGRDLTDARQRVAQLESALLEAQTISAGLGAPLSEAQREWVEQAAQSVNPAAYAQQAVQEGQYELARAVCREWALGNPYEALRVGQWVDATEINAYQAAQAPREVTTDEVIAALDENMPEMRPYFGQMTKVVGQLGDEHPLVVQSRSTNAEEAVSGMIGLYEIARASVASVQDAQSQVKKRQRKAADDVREKGLVSSGGNSPSRGGETPRNVEIMPGLSRDALDTEFAAQAGR